MSAPETEPLASYKAHVSLGAKASKFTAATVNIYRDHIEWKADGLKVPGGLGSALLTGGANLLLAGKSKSTNTIFVKSIQGVTTDKGGIGWTVVRVVAGLDVIHFKVRKAEAEQIRSLIVGLVSG